MLIKVGWSLRASVRLTFALIEGRSAAPTASVYSSRNDLLGAESQSRPRIASILRAMPLSIDVAGGYSGTEGS